MSSSKGDQECKIFVGGLHLESTKEDLQDYFGKWGEIVDAIVMTDPTSKRSRGFGFVTYAEPDSVENCLKERTLELHGRQVEAKRAIPKEDISSHSNTHSTARTKKVFLGGLSHETTKEDISDALAENINVDPQSMEVSVMTDKNTNKPRGFAFVVFEEYDHADKLCQKKFVKIQEREVEVKKAVPQDELRRNEGSGGSGKYSSSRGPPTQYPDYSMRDVYSRPMYNMGRMPGYDPYMAADYMRSVRDYPMSSYPMPAAASYDRTTASSGYSSYGSVRGNPYEMSSSNYSSMYGAGMMSAYQQNPSAYGASRSYSDYRRDRERADTQSSYHPYRR